MLETGHGTTTLEIQAAIFDMDGVLCATDEYHYLSWKTVADEYAIPFSREDNHRMRGMTRRQSLALLTEGRQLSTYALEQIIERKNILYLDAIRKMSPRDLLPGVMDLLSDLSRSGIRIGVASSSQHVRSILEKLEISNYVDAYCDATCPERTKPAPDPYLKVAEMLEAEPVRCIVFEDSQAGIEAGEKAGMCVVGLGDEDRLKNAAIVIPSMQNLDVKTIQAIYQRWLG